MRCSANRSVHIACTLVAGLAWLGGCKSSTTTPQKGESTVGGVTAALGYIVGPNGQGIANVSVRSPEHTVTSDGNGRFNIAVKAGETTTLVLENAGWAPVYRTVHPAGPGTVTVSALLRPPTLTTQIDTSVGPAKVEVPGGAQVEFPAHGLVSKATGKPPSGPIAANFTFVSATDAPVSAPVPLLAKLGNEVQPLESFGMIDIQLTADGAPVGLATGQTIQLTLPAAADAPESAGLFSADTAAGMWRVEGVAGKVGDHWVAQIPHLSWWNVDGFWKVPFDQQACVDFHTVDTTGHDVAGVELKSGWGPGGKYTIAGGTDTAGHLCEASFPLGQSLAIKWSAFVKPGAATPVTSTTSVTPSAKGAHCGTAECEVVPIVVACGADADCGGVLMCVSGACVTPGVVPVVDAGATDGGGFKDIPPNIDTNLPGIDSGGPSLDVPTIACTPKCDPGQCTDDGCGKPCGECQKGQTCNPDSKQCAACVPDCSNQTCGSDGCNGNCGICPAGQSCDNAKCVAPCAFCPTGNCNAFGFEDGLVGWDVSGDVSVIPALGQTPAPQGQKMVRLSTGLAFAAPSYAQKALCASPNVSKVTFRWRMYSEEFKEFCGSQFQDYFSVSAIAAGGTKQELMKITIDDACGKGDNNCSKCGSKFMGLDKSDVNFDKGDVWVTPWQETTLSLPAGASSATLVFEVNDVGDSIYDTVVLLDDVRLVP